MTRAFQSSPFQNYKNLKKSPKITFKKTKTIFWKEKEKGQKKCYSLSFPILGGRDSTRALQSSPFLKYKNLKNNFYSKKKFKEKKLPQEINKIKNVILLVFQY